MGCGLWQWGPNKSLKQFLCVFCMERPDCLFYEEKLSVGWYAKGLDTGHIRLDVFDLNEVNVITVESVLLDLGDNLWVAA